MPLPYKSEELSYVDGTHNWHMHSQALLQEWNLCCAPHHELLTQELLQLSNPERDVQSFKTSQRRGPLISTLLLKALIPTRDLEPADCDVALCPNIFPDIGAKLCLEMHTVLAELPGSHTHACRTKQSGS